MVWKGEDPLPTHTFAFDIWCSYPKQRTLLAFRSHCTHQYEGSFFDNIVRKFA